MNKDYLYLFLLVLLFFVPTLLRPLTAPIAGADSYYFLNQIFDKTDYDKLTTPISNFIFHQLPQNIFLIKIIMLVTTFICLFIFYHIIKINYPKSAFFGTFVMLSVFSYAQLFFRLEDDLFGMVFLMVSLLYIEKFNKSIRIIGHTIKEMNYYLLISILYLCLACSIWKFCIFYFIVFFLFTNFNKLYGLACLFLVPFTVKVIVSVLPNTRVAENSLNFIGIFTALCFVWVFTSFKSLRSEFKLPIIVFSLLMILNSKMMFAIVPIIIIALCEFFENNKDKRYKIWIFYGCLLVGSLNYSLQDFPTDSEYSLLMYAQEKSIELDKPLEVNWGIGYFAQYSGIDANYFGYYKYQEISGKIYYTTTKEDCKILKKGIRISVYSC